MLESPQSPQPESVPLPLINQFAVHPVEICLVLDDYHLIDSQSVRDSVGTLSAHLSDPLLADEVTSSAVSATLFSLRNKHQANDSKSQRQ